MNAVAITDQDFERFRQLALRHAGISMRPSKKTLVESRLRKRLEARRLDSYCEYLRVLGQPNESLELQTAIDLLTTNETSFFREPKHFQHLRDYALQCRQHSARFRVWSAACSTGEEPFTAALVLAEALGWSEWDVVASDLSTKVLARARTAHYNLDRAQSISQDMLRKYCLKGIGKHTGTFVFDMPIRTRVQFHHGNLLEPAPSTVGRLDAIFLRNVMIYFDLPTKQKVIANLLPALKPGGVLYVGHSETLNGVCSDVEMLAPAIYRKPK